MRAFALRSLLLLLFTPIFNPARAQPGTADGTYHFGTIGDEDDAAPGFKTQEDKFWVSNIFLNNGTAMFADNGTDGATATGIIKAEGGTVNKQFSLADMRLRHFNLDNQRLEVFTIILRDRQRAQVARHDLAAPQTIGTAEYLLSTFGFTVPWPPGGYASVSEIEVEWKFAGNRSPDGLTFVNMDLANIDALTVLPLTLIDFTARPEGASVQLNWATATENNVEHIVIEHSTDGTRFTTLAAVAANGRGAAYSLKHAAPVPGRNYYRLRSVDRDGRRKTYAVRSVAMPVQPNIRVIWQHGRLSLLGLSAGPVQLQLADRAGGVCWRAELRASGNTGYVALPAQLAKGMYFLLVGTATGTQAIPFLAQ